MIPREPRLQQLRCCVRLRCRRSSCCQEAFPSEHLCPQAQSLLLRPRPSKSRRGRLLARMCCCDFARMGPPRSCRSIPHRVPDFPLHLHGPLRASESRQCRSQLAFPLREYSLLGSRQVVALLHDHCEKEYFLGAAEALQAGVARSRLVAILQSDKETGAP